jgi:hypothetical protein
MSDLPEWPLWYCRDCGQGNAAWAKECGLCSKVDLLPLAQAVAEKASIYSVAFAADENCFEEMDDLDAALKPWREARARWWMACQKVP